MNCSLGLATPLKPPPHMDLEMSGEELRVLLAKSRIGTGRAGVLHVLDPIVQAGERNLEWLSYINQHRENPISLYKKGELTGIPIDEARRYSRVSIVRDFEDLKGSLPGEMTKVIFEGDDFSSEPPFEVEEYRVWAQKLDRSYQIAVRWLLLEPYLGWLAQKKKKDIRGYYFLSQIENREDYLKNYGQLSEDEKRKVKEWILSLCYIEPRQSWESCIREFERSETHLNEMVRRYWPMAQTTYRSFFDIPSRVKNSSTSRLDDSSLRTRFIRPQTEREALFLKKNIEEEWQKDFVQLYVEFVDDSGVRVSWVPGVTPHVNGLGSNEVVMDANSSLDDWDTQWTIRHEFGHVLGFPDCYLEFYDPENREIVSYQIDVNDLMCSRKGVYQPRLTTELLRVY